MKLLVVRHAVAQERDEWHETGRPDNERPLTRKGRTEMKACAKALARLVPGLDLIATSPFTRAADTAELLAAAWSSMPLLDVKELASGGSRNELLKWLASRTESCLAVVGHEPDLGSLVGSLVVGDSRAVPIPLEKAGACLLRFPERIEQGQGELRWLVYPRLLRKLAR